MKSTKTCGTICLLAGLVISASGVGAAELKKPLKVYILAGQSNMEGHAAVRTFDHIGMDPATAPMLKEMRNADGTPRVCDKVWISYLTGGKEGNIVKQGQLTAEFGSQGKEPKIGPEFTFGIYLQKQLNEPILLIKTAWGGKSLYGDFLPPSGAKKSGKETGEYYRLMVDHVKTVLKDIKKVYPGYDPEQKYELAGFVWFQGWNDMVNGGDYPNREKPGGYDLYSELLAALIRDVRKDLDAPKMHVVIGVMGTGGPTALYSSPRYKGVHQNFRDAMAAPASLPEFKGNVTAVLTEKYWDSELAGIDERIGSKTDKEKVTERELEILKKGKSNQGYHYLGSSKILGQIGKAFAEAMAAAGKGKQEKQPPPDFTKGGQKDESHDWNLGPTGARGWLYGWAGNTAEARQILVTAVDMGSPADGILKSGDVILGVGEKGFSDDARIQFANAITAAEQEKNSGKLRLIRWRDNKAEQVELKLTVMGAYSDRAPYDCQKSKKIFDLGCQAIAKKGLGTVSIPNDLNALALLASGKQEYRPMLAEYAKKAAVYQTDSMATWFYGYANMFLAEYVIATGDTSVLEGVKRLALEAAKGQGAMGLWGHKFARPDGNLNGYGAMNQPGLSLSVSMALARQAGVKDPELNRAIDKSANFLRWFVNKGAIPYGDHQPWPGHEDNGKCSSAAVFFDLLGDAQATAFYAKMSTAAYAERERGHTGNFFNLLWAMPGVSRSGPLGTAAYMKEQSWFYDLARKWDGSFGYQGAPVGEEEHGKYTSWESTGAYLLAYALPLKSLCLTGKRPCAAPALSAKETAEVIAAGRDYNHSVANEGYVGRTPDQLLAGLSSWSPAVRKRSAQGLSRFEGDFVPALLELLASSTQEARYGACEALGFLGPKAAAAAPQLRALLKDADPWLQSLACIALAELGPEARKASVNDLLRMTVTPNPADPRRTTQRAAAVALFHPFPGSRTPRTSILADSLAGVDTALLYPAMLSVLENEDSVARGSLSRIYGKLPERDIAILLPAIIKATQKLAPSNEMFADGIRLAGIDLLSKYYITEGMQLCLEVLEPDRWGAGRRFEPCLASLKRYGGNARHLVPALQKMRDALGNPKKKGEEDPNALALDKAIAAIQADTHPPKLQTAAAFMKKK